LLERLARRESLGASTNELHAGHGCIRERLSVAVLELPMLADELRSVRVYLLSTIIIAFCLKLGGDLFTHWYTFTQNMHCLLFR
jgi:hypothetical protein